MGKKEEALAELDHNRSYARISEKLILAMNGWKTKMQATQT